MRDHPAEHYLRIYRLKLGMVEAGTTHPSRYGGETMKTLVAALAAMDPNAPVRLETDLAGARFIDPSRSADC